MEKKETKSGKSEFAPFYESWIRSQPAVASVAYFGSAAIKAQIDWGFKCDHLLSKICLMRPDLDKLETFRHAIRIAQAWPLVGAQTGALRVLESWALMVTRGERLPFDQEPG